MSTHPDWVMRGKTVRQLIQELQSFEDQDLEVRLSVDGGTTTQCISLVCKSNGAALLMNCEDGAPQPAQSRRS
ncbi:MAG: hypothetical protein RJA44_2535 [Pseudomonadota bacterium]|jgi:pentose-5-phosphate-3-epimerase